MFKFLTNEPIRIHFFDRKNRLIYTKLMVIALLDIIYQKRKIKSLRLFFVLVD